MESLFRAGVSNAVSATLLAMVVAALSRPLSRRPAILHGLWLLVLLKLVTPPLYEVPIPWPTLSRPPERKQALTGVLTGAVESLPVHELPREETVVEWDLVAEFTEAPEVEPLKRESFPSWSLSDWVGPLMATWLVGTATILVVSARRIHRFQGLLRETRPAFPVDQKRVDALAGRMGLRRGPVLEWVLAKLSPMIWSLGWRPRLIIPRDLWRSLDELQRSTLIVHELAHLRRGDHRVRYFELFVTALFWWHPLVWWVRQVLRDVEEQCCDAWVVWAFPEAARSYAETLLETIDFLDKSKGPEPLLASGFGKVHHLRRRLTMILNESTPRRLGGWGMLGLFGVAAMMLPVNATWAQKPEELQKVDVVVKSVEDLSRTTEGASRIQADPFEWTMERVTALDDAPKGSVIVRLKSDNSSDTLVSGSIEQAIVQFKKLIGEIEKKASLAEKDEKRRKVLHEAIEILADLAPRIKGNEGPGKPAGGASHLMLVIRAGGADSPEKPLSKADKAEVEKLQAQVKKISGELQAKQKELAEAQSRLANLQGVSYVKVFGTPLVLHSGTKLDVEKGKAFIIVPDEEVTRKTVVMGPRKNPGTDSKVSITGKVKKVDPTNRRVEIHIGSDDGLVPGHELELYRTELAKSPKLSDQQRIDELEKKLKAMLDEVAKLKKGAPKAPSGN